MKRRPTGPGWLLLAATVLPPAAAGAMEQGELLYQRCQGCHSLAVHRTGPRHCGLFGRAAGAEPGFDYSPAMAASGLYWDEASLDAFLENPMERVPGTTMTYAGIRDPRERKALIDWLKKAGPCSAGEK